MMESPNKEEFAKAKIAVIQNQIDKDIGICLGNIENLITQAAGHGAQFCILGETFNCPYTQDFCRGVAQDFKNQQDQKACPTISLIIKLAKKYCIYIIGSIPEIEDQQMYNTAIAVNPSGDIVGKHRKLHLFDIDIPGRITYKESDSFASGNQATVFETPYGKIGMAICYDIRFAELGLLMRSQGAKVLVYPSSFSMPTGDLHFQLLVRARALDNQVYCIGSSVARFVEDPSVFQAYGHATVVDPFGKVLMKAGIQPSINYVELDFGYVDQVRAQIPISFQQRNDVYELLQQNPKN